MLAGSLTAKELHSHKPKNQRNKTEGYHERPKAIYPRGDEESQTKISNVAKKIRKNNIRRAGNKISF